MESIKYTSAFDTRIPDPTLPITAHLPLKQLLNFFIYSNK